MLKVFAEYQILPQYRPAYSMWMAEVRAKYPELEVFEGVDQPGLFVEIWSGLSSECYNRLKRARFQQQGDGLIDPVIESGYADIDWTEINNWVAGGASKIHLWYFKKVI
jgi:hypothetical protein